MITQTMQPAARESSIHRWGEQLLERVMLLSPQTGHRYEDPVRLNHYFQTAEFFERVVPGNVALAQAAFLHGVWETHRLAPIRYLLEPEVVDILDGRRTLWSFDKPDADVPQMLATNVLPSLTHARSAVLLVIEQLFHLDPEQQLAEFALVFPKQPPAPPESITISPHGFPSLEMLLAFQRLVVIPTASFFGLRLYRNLADDLCLYHGSRQRFNELYEFSVKMTESGEVTARADAIRKAVEDLEGVQVYWEWHHIASLDRKLQRAGKGDSRVQGLSHCGMITVECPEAKDCYAAIARLHLHPSFIHQTRDIEDFLHVPKTSGYEAFHTVLTAVGRDSPGRSFRVRVTYRDASRKRFEPLTPDKLAAMQRLIDARRGNLMQVFANDGRAVLLPAGSTVLNFAHAIHNDLVALAKSATVNREPVDLLHPLKEGDVVQVIVGTEPNLLPPGWEAKVPPQTVSSIRSAHNACYKPSQLKHGRKVLRVRLGDLGVKYIFDEDVYDDSILDSALEEAVLLGAKTKHPRPPANASWWLRQFALGRNPEWESGLLEEVTEATANILQNSPRVGVQALTLPLSMNGSFDHLILCKTCSPGPEQPVVGVIEGRRLTIHVARRKCGKGGRPLEWKMRYTRGQYFVIEMINRQGIAADVISVIANRGIDIIDHCAASLGPNWAVVRLHVQPVGPEQVRKTIETLENIKEVIRVIPPGNEVIPALEGPLPAREHLSFSAQSNLFICGPPLPNDKYFYGRGKQLGELRQVYQDAIAPGAAHGLTMLITGPHKIGKTSLVERFLRELRRTEFLCSCVSTRAEYGEPWRVPEPEAGTSLHPGVSDKLRAALVKEWESLTRSLGEERRIDAPKSLPDLVRGFRRDLSRYLVISVDEAVVLFLRSAQMGQETELLQFISVVSETPGVVLIWNGTEAPLVDVPSALLDRIRSGQPIRMPSLDLDDVKHLLRADNMSDRGVRIEVDAKIASDVFEFTGGNPYWCNIMARSMVANSREPAEGLVRPRARELAIARKELIEDDNCFSDRVQVFERGTPRQSVVEFVLRTLAGTASSGARQLSYEALTGAVASAGIPESDEESGEVIERLRAQGSIRRLVQRGENRYEIECPALIEHLRVRRWPRRESTSVSHA